jgi:hypothetical protein
LSFGNTFSEPHKAHIQRLFVPEIEVVVVYKLAYVQHVPQIAGGVLRRDISDASSSEINGVYSNPTGNSHDCPRPGGSLVDVKRGAPPPLMVGDWFIVVKDVFF